MLAAQSVKGGLDDERQPLRYPSLAVTNETGVRLSLLSIEAFHAELGFLSKRLQQVDLSGPRVQTDGWSRNIAEAEWPFLTFAYTGYACGNFARSGVSFKEECLAEMRWVLEAMQTPRLSGFVTPHFGPPFGTGQIAAAVFVHGHFLNLALRYRELTSDLRYDGIIHRVAAALIGAAKTTDQSILRSYRDMWWLTDNFPAMAALAAYDQIFKQNNRVIRERFLSSVKAYYLDPPTGLFATYVDPPQKKIRQGPRGISTMYGLHFVKDFAPEFARRQYALAKREFVRTGFGFTAVREFPATASGRSDIDSGPVLFGLGPSASGFAIAACALNGDMETAWELAKAATLVGQPVWTGTELNYRSMPEVGQAVILFGKSCLLP